jgi:hypothetical protein
MDVTQVRQALSADARRDDMHARWRVASRAPQGIDVPARCRDRTAGKLAYWGLVGRAAGAWRAAVLKERYSSGSVVKNSG